MAANGIIVDGSEIEHHQIQQLEYRNRFSLDSLTELYPLESPSHDSNGSEICSPERTTENELEHDADSDSSGDGSFFDHIKSRAKSQENRRKARRTSSNVFVFKKSDNESKDIALDSLYPGSISNNETENEFIDIDMDDVKRENGKQLLCKSQSYSSTDESEKTNTTLGNCNSTLLYGFPVCGESISSTSGGEETEEMRKSKKLTAVDGLLFEIYDRFHNPGLCVIESDITEFSTTSVNSVYITSTFENDERLKIDKHYLETKEICELESMLKELKRGINMLSSKLVRLLKQRDRSAQRIQENFNILTALLQAISQKRRVDTRIRFSFIPRSGKRGFRQWIDALKAVARIRHGIPPSWRKRTWLSLAEYFLKDTDWDRIKKLCFNDRRNPDDDELDTQIVKDLHRTGCGWFFEHDTAEDRASLKRVLLAYARWNKSIGYCQGFNVIAALILQVMEGSEEDALKVMIFLVDYVLPRNYFANNLHALSVDMAVLRDLMLKKLPELALLLLHLQKEAMDKTINTAASYEPPLINMFTMQWFLTLFATCLPRNTVLRIWDCVLLEGSEVLLRVALSIWAKLGMCFDNNVATASDFYMKMGQLIQELISDDFINVQKLMQTVYHMASFPWPLLVELREKYTYDIHPFSTFTDKSEEKRQRRIAPKPVSDEEEVVDSDDDKMLGCLGFVASSTDSSPSKIKHSADTRRYIVNPKSDITKATPGAYITDQEAHNAYKAQMKESERIRENDLLDVDRLRSQYGRMRRLQQKAMLVFNNDFKDESLHAKNPPSAINHLFVDVNKVAPPRTRYRKPDNFPALKAPSKGSKPPKPVKETVTESTGVPVRENSGRTSKENSGRLIYENNGTSDVFQKQRPSDTNDVQQKQQPNDTLPNKTSNQNSDSFSISNPYVTREVQALSDLNDLVKDNLPQEHRSIQTAETPYDNSNIQTNSHLKPKLIRGSSSKRTMKSCKIEKDLKSTSLLYQVHKSALYPSNFNPFPHRNYQGRRSVVSGK